MHKNELKDLQSEPDFRKLPISKVGVKGISYPVVILEKSHTTQHTVAMVNMYVDLPHNLRATHMSRFIEILNKFRDGISTQNIKQILNEMKNELNTETAYFEIEFPYFITKNAPVSGLPAKMQYSCRIAGNHSEDLYFLEVKVPVLSLCPCSREISEYGAHNQRSIITIRIKARERIWIEDLVEIAEKSASTDIYSILKREDEKYLTEKAYDNPMFVEDMVRSTAEKILKTKGILWFSVESENLESIHNHSAYAMIDSDKINA